MKNYLKFLISLGLIGTFLIAVLLPLPAKAGDYDCLAGINFDASPKKITDTQSVAISGSITLNIPDGNSCVIPGTNNQRMSQLILSVFDEKSSQEIFYVGGFTYSKGVSNKWIWTINPRQIGLNELKQTSLTSANSLNLVGIVKVTSGDGKWYQLTKSSPVSVAVSVTPDAKTTTTDLKDTTTAKGTEATTNDTASGGMQSQSSQTLYNPIKNADNLLELLLKIMQGFLMVVAVWAVVFVVIGGFKLVISQGNEEAVTAAKKTIIWAVLGVVIVMLAFSIIAIIQNFIGIDVKDVKTSQNKTFIQTQKL